jgi:PPOX class probable FMN-dependent enzyme
MDHNDEHLITTMDQLREIAGHPGELAAGKVIDHIDPICERIIAASPFLVIATRGKDGLLDLSPKGDPAGFVGVLDDRTLAIPDRVGNRRFDTYENILFDPAVTLLFMIPGHGDTLRVAGKARISRAPDLLARFALRGKQPQFVLLVAVEEVFTHCPKCMIRSGLWKPESWPDRSNVPSLAEAIAEHTKMRSVEELEPYLEEDNRERLY